MSISEVTLLRKRMVSVAREAGAGGLVVGHAGNLSVRLGDRVLITPHGVSLAHLKPEDILTIDFDGVTLAGTGTPSMDVGLHLSIYKNLNASAIVHTHPLFTNALAIANLEIVPLTVETALILRNIPVVRQTGLDLTGITSEILELLKKSDLIVMKHHGVIALGDNLEDALLLNQLIEENSKMMAIAKMFGSKDFSGILSG